MNTGQVTYEIDLSGARTAMEGLMKWARSYRPPKLPAWVRRPPGLYQPIPSTFRKCVWCKDHLPIFGPPTVDLGDGWAHTECVDKAERFALKASIRNRTNPSSGYFPGWRTP